MLMLTIATKKCLNKADPADRTATEISIMFFKGININGRGPDPLP